MGRGRKERTAPTHRLPDKYDGTERKLLDHGRDIGDECGSGGIGWSAFASPVTTLIEPDGTEPVAESSDDLRPLAAVTG